MRKLITLTVILFAIFAFSSCEDKGSKAYPDIDEKYQNVHVEVIKEVQQ